MAKVAITEKHLEDIADAIREKTGVSTTYLPSEMANAIMTISGGGGITPTGTISIIENGTYNVTNYASASVEVPTGPTINNQNKTVSPSISQQTVTFDSGYTGLGTVTVNAMPSGTAGTPTATKGTVSNHNISVTPSVTNTTGYIIGSTKTGTAVTVSASELVSGNKAISSNGTNIDVTNYATVSVDVSGGGITPTGNINITSAGETDVTNYATATVAPVTFVNTISPLVTTNNGSVSSSGLVSIPWTINESTYPVYAGGYADEEDEITLWNSGNLEYQLSNINLPSSASSSASSGYTSKATIGRSTSDQYINIGTGYNGSGAYYKISAVANGTAGTPTATKGSVSNHSISITPSVTNTTGYITGSTKTGTAVTVSASELVSGTYTVNSSGTKDVTNYESISVASGSATAPASISGTAASVSTGNGTLTLTKTVSVTPSVTAGYVSSGTAGNSSVSLTASVTTKAATTYHPSLTDQTISASQYLTGAQTIKAVTTTNLTAANIKKDVVVKIGDSTDDDCVTTITGTYEGSGGGAALTVDTSTATLSSAATSISFTGLAGEPTSFAVVSAADLATGASPWKTAAVVFDGTDLHGQTIRNTSNAQVTYDGSSFSKTYSNGTLTITGSGTNFQANQYKLVYTYGGSDIGTADVQVGSGATSITFTGLEEEPSYFSCIFKSNFSTSSGYQRVIVVVYDGTSTYGMEMDSSAKHSTAHWTYSYSSGSLTITSSGTNAGGYFHQPGYYQLTYATEGSGGNYQTKSATYYATSSQQTASIAADSGYDALKKVNITIAPVTTTNLIASNIVSGVTIQVGDAVDSDRITSVTGNVVLQHYYTGSSAPSSSLGSNGDLYLQS